MTQVLLGSLVGLMLCGNVVQAQLLDSRGYSACHTSQYTSACIYFTASLTRGADMGDGYHTLFTMSPINIYLDALHAQSRKLVPYYLHYARWENQGDTWLPPFSPKTYYGERSATALPSELRTIFFEGTCSALAMEPGCSENGVAIPNDPNRAYITFTATPEPATWLLLATGLLGVGIAARRRRHASFTSTVSVAVAALSVLTTSNS